MSFGKRVFAEFIGTFWLVFAGCGSAIFAANIPYDNPANPLGIGLLGVSIAFGLSVLTMAFAVGRISGGHFNPAVTLGLWAGRVFPSSSILPYIFAQVLGAVAAGGLLYLMASGRPGFSLDGSNPLATNGFGAHSPSGYGLLACFVAEVVLTFFFLIVILGATDNGIPGGFAPIPIGLALTLIHLISIPITNTSVNPARSTGVALFVGTELFSQVWLFWVAPILGAILAGWAYTYVIDPDPVEIPEQLRSEAVRR
ncbi:MAG: aquaporin Z [Elainella sp.]